MSCLPASCSLLSLCHAPAPPAFYPLSLHDALPISGSASGAVAGRDLVEGHALVGPGFLGQAQHLLGDDVAHDLVGRSEEHTSELQSRGHLVCRLLLEKKKRRRTRPVSESL